MPNIELVAFLLGVVTVVLVVRRSVWNYPFALAMVSLYLIIFFRERLYSDALLQIFFFVINVHGWLHWQRLRAETGDIRILALDRRQQGALIIALVLVTLAWSFAMDRLTNADFPYWDGAVAIVSVFAQILQVRRYVESWILWVLVDVAAIGLYWTKDLRLTALLYAVFLGLALWGYASWAAARRASLASAAVPGGAVND